MAAPATSASVTCSLQDLANTQVLNIALAYCSGASLTSLRQVSTSLAEALPASSPLWQDLLRHSSVVLQGKASAMFKARRLGLLSERSSVHAGAEAEVPAPISKQSRYRLIVTGARASGISTLVRLLAQRTEQPDAAKDMSVFAFSANLEGTNLPVSVVDKRSTVKGTPLSAALYSGHTAALFVFDAGRMEDTLPKAAWCIEELRQTVGLKKFRLMPKLLVCHKADLLMATSPGLEDADARAACLPAMCEALLATHGMDLVFTSREDPTSAELAFALAAEGWPEEDPDVASRTFPVGSSFNQTRQQLRPTRTVVRRSTVVNVNPRRRTGNIFDELLARVPLAE